MSLEKKMKTEYEMPMTVLVDSMEDQSRALFSDLPSPVFIIDGDGRIQHKSPWPDATLIESVVANLSATGKLSPPSPKTKTKTKEVSSEPQSSDAPSVK